METFNTQAEIINLEGIKVPARLALCTVLPTVIHGLEALKLLSKNFIVKLCIGIVITALGTFKTALCPDQVDLIPNEN